MNSSTSFVTNFIESNLYDVSGTVDNFHDAVGQMIASENADELAGWLRTQFAKVLLRTSFSDDDFVGEMIYSFFQEKYVEIDFNEVAKSVIEYNKHYSNEDD